MTAAIVAAVLALAGCSHSSSSASSLSSQRARTSTSTRVPARVSLFGDSLSVQARALLRSQGRAHGLRVTVEAYFGLAPCDLTQAVYRDVQNLAEPLDALVLVFSGNNLTPCMQRDGKPLTGAAYFAKYRSDIGTLVAAGTDRSVPVLVVGAPSFPDAQNSPDRIELNSVLRDVASKYPGARFVASTSDVSPEGFARVLPCLPEETAALGCDGGEITVRGGNGIHFDDPRTVPCPSDRGDCTYTAGGHRFATAIMRGLAALDGLAYADLPPSVGVPAIKALDG